MGAGLSAASSPAEVSESVRGIGEAYASLAEDLFKMGVDGALLKDIQEESSSNIKELLTECGVSHKVQLKRLELALMDFNATPSVLQPSVTISLKVFEKLLALVEQNIDLEKVSTAELLTIQDLLAALPEEDDSGNESGDGDASGENKDAVKNLNEQ